jgi:hypothetical protein
LGEAAELVALQEEYQAWVEALPESLQESETAAAFREVYEIDPCKLRNF